MRENKEAKSRSVMSKFNKIVVYMHLFYFKKFELLALIIKIKYSKWKIYEFKVNKRKLINKNSELRFIINFLLINLLDEIFITFFSFTQALISILYRSSKFIKRGINVKDQLYEQIYPESLNATTTCTLVNLTQY